MSPINLEILAYEPSPLGMLCLRRREMLSRPGTIVTEVTLNHEFLMSSYHTASERALALSAIAMHGGKNLRVLVGGLGLGYTAREVLTSDNVGSLEVVELLPQVIDWLEQGLVPTSEELQSDERLAIVAGDVYARLAKPPEKTYDLILIDVDHSPDDQLSDANAPFYTEAGLAAAKQHLSAHGVLAVWSYAESSPFADALRRVFSEVAIEEVTFENEHIHEQQTDWLFFARG